MSPGGSQASAGEGVSPDNIGIGVGIRAPPTGCHQPRNLWPGRAATATEHDHQQQLVYPMTHGP